jgi:hypothetical protein
MFQDEFCAVEEINGTRLALAKDFAELFEKILPPDSHLKEKMGDLSAWMEGEDGIGFSVWDEKLRFLSTQPEIWMGCAGSAPQFRGLPCGKRLNYKFTDSWPRQPVSKSRQVTRQGFPGF